MVLAALVAPYASALLGRLTGLETPYAKFQFATPTAERELLLDAERDLTIFDRFADLLRGSRFIQFDCWYAALEAGGLNTFSNTDKFKRNYNNYRNAIAFRNRLTSYVIRLENARRQGCDIESLKTRVRPVAEKLSRLLFVPKEQSVDTAYSAAMSEVDKQDGELRMDGIENKLNKTSAELQSEQKDPDPQWCEPNTQEIKGDDLRMLIDETRFVYGAVAELFGFTGNAEGVITVLTLAKKYTSSK